MKKLIFTISLCICISLSFAQDNSITITNSSSPYPGLTIKAHDDSNNVATSHPMINFQTSDGTQNNLLAIQTDRVLGSLIFSGYTGSSHYQAARIEVKTKSDFDVNQLADMNFRIGGFNTGNTRMTISGETGNVGIGTTTPAEKLTVNGKILCEEVEVVVDINNYPDYVFQKYYTGTSSLKADYIMPTIEEVEAFTKENHHLPEVPSAAEIKEEGMQLKEMTTLLLQKVEELTLYTIEQEKRIKQLEAKLAEKPKF